MQEIRLFEVGDWVWGGWYSHAKKQEMIIGPVRVTEVRGTTDKELKKNNSGELYVICCGDNVWYNGTVFTSRQELEESIYNNRRKWELAAEERLEAERKKLEENVPNPVDKV